MEGKGGLLDDTYRKGQGIENDILKIYSGRR
jgi:hypothetical protein